MRNWIRLGLPAVVLASTVVAASANDYVVTKTADTADGVCDADCSLREAIIAANTNPGPDRVILSPGLVYTLTRGPADPPGAVVPTSGDLDITDGLTIDGHGATVNGNALDRVFDIQGSFTVTFNDLTITGGVASGFLSLGGGVSIRLATVVFNNCLVTGNSTAIESGARDDGGGIASFGFFNPTTATTTLAVLTLNNTTVSNNSGASGGGLLCVLCQLTTTGGAFTGNTAVNGDGAGLALFGQLSSAVVKGAAFAGNTGATRGGAMAIPVGASTVNVSYSRILGNGAGAGTAVFSAGTGGVAAINNWWGCNYGPGVAGAGCTANADTVVGGGATTTPYLVLSASAAPGSLTAPAQSAITADLTFNSSSLDTSSGGHVPNGTPAAFASTLGTIAQPTVPTTNGKAIDVFTASQLGGSAALAVSVDNQTVSATVALTAPAVRKKVHDDVDGDGLGDLIVWRAPTGTWYWLTSSTGYAYANAVGKQWGNQSLGDVPFLADIDGDGQSDLILWRASTGTWYWLTSSTGYSYASAGSKQWGNQSLGDVPMLADVDGDGRADLVIWRASTGTWYWLTSSSGYDYASATGVQWGNQSLGDVPLLGDVDRDGRADLIVWRASSGTWYWLTSSSNYSYASAAGVQWGNQALGDKPFVADVDGDGATDLVVWRASTGTWYWLTSSTGYAAASAGQKQWGNQALGDVPMIGDLDGDGRADLVLWRASTGTWLWLSSLGGFDPNAHGEKAWGNAAAGDVPMIK